MIEYIAKLVGAKTNGAGISPLSPKNLPKTSYKIPDDDLEMYKAAIKDFPTRTIEMKGKERTLVDMVLIKELNKKFDKIIIKSQQKNFDINKDRKKKGLKGKEYIHSFGKDMWEKYCEFMKNEGEEYGRS